MRSNLKKGPSILVGWLSVLGVATLLVTIAFFVAHFYFTPISNSGKASPIYPWAEQVTAVSPKMRQKETEIAGPLLKWKAKLGEGMYTSVSTAKDTVLVSTAFDVYALDATTGKVKWEWDPPTYPVSAAAITQDTVYIGIASVSAYALDAPTGHVKWWQRLSNDPSDGVSNPIVADGLVYFGTGWSDWSCCEGRGSGGSITALDGKTGQTVWHIKTRDHYGSGGLPGYTFAVGSGMLYFWAGRGPDWIEEELHAIDGKTGKEIWKIASDATFPFVAPDGTLFSVLERELLSLDAKTGQERWRWKLDNTKASLSEPVIVDDTVYIVGNQQRDICFEGPCAPRTNHTDSLYALDLITGREIRKQQIDGGYYSTLDMVLFQDYLCYVLEDVSGDASRWYLVAVDRHDGKSWWQFEIDGYVSDLPASDDSGLYFVTNEGTVYALQFP